MSKEFVIDYDDATSHIGHNIVIARYLDLTGNVRNTSIECEDCFEVLADEDEE